MYVLPRVHSSRLDEINSIKCVANFHGGGANIHVSFDRLCKPIRLCPARATDTTAVLSAAKARSPDEKLVLNVEVETHIHTFLAIVPQEHAIFTRLALL